MAANRFASLIHRKTNRITLILVYAFLEWSLIFFILLNSLFSYFILRFADYFGLKRPCLFCSRLDRFFDASSRKPRDLLCDDHALEISNSQQRSRGVHTHSKPVQEVEESRNDFFLVGGKISSSLCAPIESDLGIVDYPIGDEGQVYNGLKFPRSVFVLEQEDEDDKNTGSVTLNHSVERRVLEEETEEKKKEEEYDDDDDIDEEFSCYVSSFDCNKEVITVEEEGNKVDLAVEVETSESARKQNLEFYIDEEDSHLIPVEFYKPSDEVREISDINGDFILDFGAEPDFTAEKEEVIITAANESKAEEEEEVIITAADESKAEDAVTTNLGASTNDLLQMHNDDDDDNETETETDAEVSIGTEIPDHEQLGDVTSQQQLHNSNDDVDNDHEEEDTLEFRTITNINEERFRETPASLERSHSLHNAMFHLERRTESVDGIECSEGGVVLTVDKLKLELQEERKALTALYEELEEERNASAIAANETMAMINRLHEEKAAMQMEALQYQRMMEEQAEFDQEALQLLNELMVNREKENAELEKELEVYRKRLEEFEAKEKMGMLRRRMRDSSVDSYRNNGDSDENNNNGDVHRDHKNVEGVSDWKYSDSEMESTPVDVVLRLDECLDDYEGERLSILGRLKFLEEKLTDLNNEEDGDEEVKTFENGNGHFHGKETNGKHRVIKSKRLLPLFDAVDGELQENGLGNGNHHENGIDESESGENVTIEEEVDELYERLEALEADREFLRHCVGSLKKGDKGVHLLHEILQHLRDLRNIDLNRVKENGDMSF
ncbi:PREDICTED: myosin-binding protein 2-like isoform X2 [Camelina sativa]|uniref:Myosin-binding protein 2-like isoform X2 n=1 Tax=Camelina sativa TaxID=90675 RepID=A0ABM0ST60_CAMSA|nr:PREDICTED: myosin-binding protein 2-like isoform X2 [Camelina sativa]